MNKVIYDILREWLDEALPEYVHGNISFRRVRDPEDTSKHVFEIYTNVPGYLIGKAGCIYDKYKAKLLEELKYWGYNEISIVEVEGFVTYRPKKTFKNAPQSSV